MPDWPGTPDVQWPGTPEKKTAAQQPSSRVGDFFKSLPTDVAQTAAGFARGEQIESEQRAMAFTDKPNAGPEVPTGEAAVKEFGLHKPEGPAGEAGAIVGDYLLNPLTYFGPGSAVAKFLTTAGAVAGAVAGKEVGGVGGEIVGALAGGATPAAISRVAAPILINQARNAAAQVLQAEGVNAITAGQRTGSKALEYWEGYLGDAPFAGGRATASREEAGRQFTQALLRRTGENADLATPQVVDRAFTRIGNDMDALAARSDTQMDQQFVNDLYAANDEYNLTVQEGARRGVVNRLLDDFTARLSQSPTLTGEQAQHFRSRIRSLQRRTFGDPELSEALRGYGDALDNATERSLQNPQDILAWQRARSQYANLIPIAEATGSGAGEAAAEGIITPAKMRQVLTATKRGKRDYSRGRGPYSAVVHAGNLLMTPLPNSGTAQREMARAFASALGAAAGYTVGGGGAEGVGAAAIGAAAAPGAMGRAIMSEPAQTYLSGQVPGQAAARAFRGQLPGGPATAARSVGPLTPDVVQQYLDSRQ